MHIFRCFAVYYTMIKATVKNVITALGLLAMVVVILLAIDKSATVATSANTTKVKVFVVDVDGTPIHNAQVTLDGKTFFTDDKGYSPSIELANPVNSYDKSISDWFTATVTVTKQGYVPAVVFNCVAFNGQTRKLTVKVYAFDGSELPCVCYVESPPQEYVDTLFAK